MRGCEGRGRKIERKEKGEREGEREGKETGRENTNIHLHVDVDFQSRIHVDVSHVDVF